MKENKLRLLSIILFFVSAFMMVLVCSATTSPIYPNYKGWDSGLFQVIGKGWTQGYIPYKDLYDQKGPALFFLECLGYMMTGNKFGVFVIQIIFAFVSEIIIYKILCRSFDVLPAALITAIGYFVFSNNYEFGNLCEEYANPFLLISLFFMLKWLYGIRSNDKKHRPVYAFVYGAAFGFCLMSRLTNAVYICMMVLVIVIYLCIHREWVNLLQNALFFILGVSVIVVPFMVYFAVKQSTYEFWYGTLLYNISYAKNSDGGITTIIKGVLGQIGSYAIVTAGMLHLLKKDYLKGIMLGSLGVVTELLLMNIMNYGHYAMITFPLLVVAVSEFKSIINSKSNEKGKASLIYKLAILAMLFTALVVSFRTYKEMNKLVRVYHKYSITAAEGENASYEQLLNTVSKIPKEERNSLVGYGTNPWFYLDMDITPACRFFVMQDWQAEFSESFTKYLVEEFEQKQPMWIVYSSNKESTISKVLDENYEVYDKEDVIDSTDGSKLILYKHK